MTQKYAEIHGSLVNSIKKTHDPEILFQLDSCISFLAGFYPDNSKDAEIAALRAAILLQRVKSYKFTGEVLTPEQLEAFFNLVSNKSSDIQQEAIHRLQWYLNSRQEAVSLNGIDTEGLIRELKEILSKKDSPYVLFFKSTLVEVIEKASLLKRVLKGELVATSPFSLFKTFIDFQVREIENAGEKSDPSMMTGLRRTLDILHTKLSPLIDIDDLLKVYDNITQLKQVQEALVFLQNYKSKTKSDFGFIDGGSCQIFAEEITALQKAKKLLKMPEAKFYSFKFTTFGDVNELKEFYIKVNDEFNRNAPLFKDVLKKVLNRYLTKEFESRCENETKLIEFEKKMCDYSTAVENQYDQSDILIEVIKNNYNNCVVARILLPLNKSTDYVTVLDVLVELKKEVIDKQLDPEVVKRCIPKIEELFKSEINDFLKISLETENIDVNYDKERLKLIQEKLSDISQQDEISEVSLNIGLSNDFIFKKYLDHFEQIPGMVKAQEKVNKIMCTRNTDRVFMLLVYEIVSLFNLIHPDPSLRQKEKKYPEIASIFTSLKENLDKCKLKVSEAIAKKEKRDIEDLLNDLNTQFSYNHLHNNIKDLTNGDFKIYDLPDEKPFTIMHDELTAAITEIDDNL